MKATFLWGLVSGLLISLATMGIWGTNKAFSIMLYLTMGVIVLLLILSGALICGDRIRANFNSEDNSDRNRRNKLINKLVVFILPYIGLAYLLYLVK
ncbi:DUF5316 family protein [Paenibacillus prosopidis]|uniref:DUF5316 domain-containing protein n=1 Tax=Paenibacillus prosopidis TaxID=630520 RepID=A0A368VEY0_9BACL|nr:DUF5316 family protein [Paenibacillus prosopidis]RCW39622.1 hypothetical protein DFP97_1602 [Paenibacillus prosopidis]